MPSMRPFTRAIQEDVTMAAKKAQAAEEWLKEKEEDEYQDTVQKLTYTADQFNKIFGVVTETM